jgi:alcohol dehydrogenase
VSSQETGCYCNGGRPNLCQSSNTSRTNGTLISGARRLSLNREPIYHYSGLSVSPSTLVSQNALIKIPGGQMAVVGLGGVGMNALLGGVVAGAERIVAVDLNADKLLLARVLGATDTFLAGNADAVEEIRQATGGGLDYVIETAGSIPAMNLTYAIAARARTVVSGGLPASTATFSYLCSALVSD